MGLWSKTSNWYLAKICSKNLQDMIGLFKIITITFSHHYISILVLPLDTLPSFPFKINHSIL